MYRLSSQQVATALGQVIANALIQGESVPIADLGRFEVRRTPSQVQEDDEGRLVLTPPQASITFTPSR